MQNGGVHVGRWKMLQAVVPDKVGQPDGVCGMLWWVLWELSAPNVSHVVLQSGELRQAGNINQGSKQHGCSGPKTAA